MGKNMPPSSFKVGEVRQLRRPMPVESGEKAQAGTHFVVVSMTSVRRGRGFTWEYVLWNTGWTNAKKQPPSSLVLRLVQGALKAHTRPCMLQSPLVKSSASSTETALSTKGYFGKAARSAERVK